MREKELTVIVPIYNEEQSIEETIGLINNHVNCWILAINDCSTDNSLKILKALQKKYKNLRVISKRKNEGYGAALKTGFLNSKTKFLSFLDADLTYHPKYIPVMLKLVKNNNLDCAWCNRYGGHINRMPIERKIANKAIVFLFFIYTGKYIPDVTCGERVFRTKSMLKLDPKSLPNGLDMISALSKRIIHRKLRYKIIPCDYAAREGSSKLNAFGDFIKMVKNVIFEK